ncbi:PDR/VanB family oxidoreductase [Bordetella tumulicola]|uniref:PDR/VanB family oxidoreductase n=1 Tax=Bordetella tumulicola TaxID=1649133 RepID=UPI0039EE701F
MASFLPMRIGEIQRIADTVVTITLEGVQGSPLPSYEPGAHVDIRLPNGLLRSYSLTAPYDRTRPYTIAVHRGRASGGGSSYIHEHLSPGDEVEVSVPRNLFPLLPGMHTSVLIAGGIGVTPLYCMAQHLTAQRRPWRLAYAARSRGAAAFADALQTLASQASAGLTLHFDDEAAGHVLNIENLIKEAPADAHFYCCGPGPMLDGYHAACSALERERVHCERFGGQAIQAASGSFEIELTRSSRTLHVGPDQTILDALLDAGIDVEYSCMQGICGSCVTPVLDGEPDHRDAFLSLDEQAAGDRIMICCSRSRSAKLVLDR